MTLYGMISSLVWAAVALVALRQTNVLVTAAVQRGVAVKREDPIDIPEDLVAFVNSFGSDWARADAAKAIRERYEQTRNWNMVRRAVGLGGMSAA